MNKQTNTHGHIHIPHILKVCKAQHLENWSISLTIDSIKEMTYHRKHIGTPVVTYKATFK